MSSQYSLSVVLQVGMAINPTNRRSMAQVSLADGDMTLDEAITDTTCITDTLAELAPFACTCQ